MNSRSAHQTEETDDWLSPQQASAMLGVATSTLRRWSRNGQVPMQRSCGGHQRFPRTAIMRLAKGPQTATTMACEVRKLISQDAPAQPSPSLLADCTGGLSQRLFGLLMRCVNQRGDDARYLSEARTVGASYGSESQLAGVSLHDTVAMFLSIRSTFLQLARPIPGIAQPTDLAELSGLLARIERMMDAILLSVIAEFERR